MMMFHTSIQKEMLYSKVRHLVEFALSKMESKGQ